MFVGKLSAHTPPPQPSSILKLKTKMLKNYSVTFLLPTAAENLQSGLSENVPDFAPQSQDKAPTTPTSAAAAKTSPSITRTTSYHTSYEHVSLVRISQPSPSGGRYSILNRDFSLKAKENDDSAKIHQSMTSPLRVDTGGHDQVDFQFASPSGFRNELLKEVNGECHITSTFHGHTNILLKKIPPKNPNTILEIIQRNDCIIIMCVS